MSTDLHPNPRLEARLRAAFEEVIPQLMNEAALVGESVAATTSAGLRVSSLPTRPERSARALAAAAAVVALLGGAGLWTVTDRDAGTSSETEPVDSDTASSAPAFPLSDAVPVMPRPSVPDPAWRLTNVIDNEADPPLGLVYLSSAAFDGPMVEIQLVADGESWSFGAQSTIPVGGTIGTLSSDGVASLLEWVDADGNRLRAFATSVPVATVRAVAAKTRLVGGRAVIDGLQSWESVAPHAAAALVRRQVEYAYESSDGRQLSIRIYGGGMNVDRQRVGDESRLSREINGEGFWFVDNGDSRFHANVLRGFWAWEFDGTGFAQVDDFLDTAASVTTVDESAWLASLDPEQSGVGSQRNTGQLDVLLEGVPLPADFDVAALRQSLQPESQYQVVAGVSGAVVCAWLDQWFTAVNNGDDERRAEAAEALATSRSWSMLLDIADEGAWPDEVWQWADAVNGLGGIMSGLGPQPPSAEAANSALGCRL